MNHHSMSDTTVTLEMAQVENLNQRLTRTTHAPVTAGSLGVAQLPEKAVLRRVSASGPPCFPYVQGHFQVSGDQGEAVRELHTPALKQLSDMFHLHQTWGVA